MKYKKIMIGIVILALGLGRVSAQQNTNSSGGENTGNGGIVSFSLGQIAYTAHESSTISLIAGVQQPYEITVLTSISNPLIDFELKVYPNPTTGYLTLLTEATLKDTIDYRLTDMNGIVIMNGEIISNSTNIFLENIPISTYFLSITNKRKVIKTFKIIKI